MWRKPEHLATTIRGHWCVMGDFSSVLYSGDRVLVTAKDTADFEHLLEHTNLVEMKSNRHFFSWSNEGHGDRRISSRIDRACGNTGWHLCIPMQLLKVSLTTLPWC